MNPMLRLHDLQLESNLLLAPIAGYCDLAFRLVVRPLGGLGLASTDLINPRGVLEQTPRTRGLLRTEPADRPLCIQLYGCEPAVMADAARWCVDHGADVIDINMGCPVDKVSKKGGGAAVLRDQPVAIGTTEAVVRAVDAPVTIKLRLGWERDEIVAPGLARDLESVGVAAIAVHGRTVEDNYATPARLDEIARVVDAVRSIPVIGNGDVRSPADAANMLARTGCAGVMVGRAALRDPWIFRDTHAFLTTGRAPDPPTPLERLTLVRDHFENLVRLRGDRLACALFRQRITWYAPKLGVPRPIWDPARTAADVQTLRGVLDTINEYLHEVHEAGLSEVGAKLRESGSV